MLTFGIRPHLSVFAGSFSEFQIEFDTKGFIARKRKARSEWNQAEQASTAPPTTRPESKPEGNQKPQPKSEVHSR